MIRRAGLCLLMAALGLAAFGCGGSDKAASTTRATPTTETPTTTATPTTSTSLAPVAPTTTLSPMQTAANAYYFGVLAGPQPAEYTIAKKFRPTTSKKRLSAQPQVCSEAEVAEQQFIDKMNAVAWPPEVRAQASDLIAKEAALVSLYNGCAHAPGTLSGQAGFGVSIPKASDDLQAATAAFRAVLGLPIAQ